MQIRNFSNKSLPFLDEDISNKSTESQDNANKKTLIIKLKEHGFLGGFFIICLLFTLLNGIVYILARYNSDFAEFYTRYPAAYLRAFLGTITSIFPFSIAEAVLLLIPVFAIAYIVHSIKVMRVDTRMSAFTKKLIPLLCLIMLLFSTFTSAFATGYFRNPLSENLNLNQQPVSVDDLNMVADKIDENIKILEKDIYFNFESSSYMPYSYDILVDKLNNAYLEYSYNHEYISHFYSHPKQIALSRPMTYTQISGVYTFFTGEANINVNYPDYIQPFTIAHEMAHQRGISREDEANFVAFLVCMESNDSYIKYSALMNVNEYVLSALRKASRDDYRSKYYALPSAVRNELKAYSIFFNKYKNETVSKVTTSVNNTFLQSQGQTDGIKSYGMVVDLLVAYYKNN